jgi:hypothetical protein
MNFIEKFTALLDYIEYAGLNHFGTESDGDGFPFLRQLSRANFAFRLPDAILAANVDPIKRSHGPSSTDHGGGKRRVTAERDQHDRRVTGFVDCPYF